MMNVMEFVTKPFRLLKLKIVAFIEWVRRLLSYFTDLVKTIIVLVLTTVVVFWVSTLFYGLFYYYYVPVVSQERPVYFHFRVCDSGVGMCSFPQANISLVQESSIQVFKMGQAYKIVLDLDLPESEANRKLGMFMVDMRLYNKRGETVHHSSRTTTLHHKSDLLQLLETLVFAPFFLFGYMHQKQILHVELFPSYRDLSFDPSVGAVIELQNFKVEVYTANLKIFAQFSGIRYFLYYWPITSAVVGIAWNCIVSAFIMALSWYNFVWPLQQQNGGHSVEVMMSQVKNKYKRRRQDTGGRSSLDSSGHSETLGAFGKSEETSVMRVSPSRDIGRLGPSPSWSRGTSGSMSPPSPSRGTGGSMSPPSRGTGGSMSPPSRETGGSMSPPSRETGLRLRHTATTRLQLLSDEKLPGNDDDLTDDEDSEGVSLIPV